MLINGSEYVIGPFSDLQDANLQDANLWGANLQDANLWGANLQDANLWGANLQDANLQDANLRGAILRGADLRGANLQDSDLQDANLQDADLRGANLQDANLQDANLRGANLQGAILRGANLWGANLQGATLPPFQIVPEEGSFIAFKKVDTGVIKILIPEDAKRTSTLVGRKCRASYVLVLEGSGNSPTHTQNALEYKEGEIVVADSYDDDIRIECTNGIHFFMTRKEAEDWV